MTQAMHLLYYWTRDNYRRDLDLGAGFHLNQKNDFLHKVEIGESVWSFSRNSKGSYVLAAELVVSAKTINPPGFRYGPFRIWGDLEKSSYFSIESQTNIEPLIRGLSCTTNASKLGMSFQGARAVKSINPIDHELLRTYSKTLSPEPRAKIFPEDQLEAAIVSGDQVLVKSLLAEDKSGMASKRKKYFFTESQARNQKLVRTLRELYDGCCQLSGWDPRNIYGKDLCEAHHLHWLSRGGEDKLENMLLISPNFHRAIHRCDAQFNFENGTILFPNQEHQMMFNEHIDLVSNISF
jgi:predicted HNH restriction endonuclease